MKRLLGCVCMLVMLCMVSVTKVSAQDGVVINKTNFPDDNFRAYVSTLKGASDGVFTEAELKNIVTIDCSSKGIKSLKGVEYFTNMGTLICDKNELTQLDISNCKELWYIRMGENAVAQLDVSNLTKLEHLYCGSNKLNSIDVSKNTKLIALHCHMNNISEIDVSNNIELRNLAVYDNKLTKLDVEKNEKLEHLYASGNQITELKTGNKPNMVLFRCQNNKLNNIDMTKMPKVNDVMIFNNPFTDVDLSNNSEVTSLLASGTNVVYYQVEHMNNLTDARIFGLSRNIGTVSAEGIKIKDVDSRIEPGKVTKVTGATYDATTGTFTNYKSGTNIVYTYVTYAGTNKVEYDVTLSFNVKTIDEEETATEAASTEKTTEKTAGESTEFVTEGSAQNGQEDKSGTPWIWWLIIPLLLVVAAIVIYVVIKKKK